MKLQILSMADISHCPDVFNCLKEIADITTVEPEQEVLLEKIRDFDAYFASLKVRADRDVLERAERLRAIATPSTGLDHIDVGFAESRGIEILSLKEETEFLNSVTCTAEMAWALLLAVVRRLPWSFEAAKKGEWARDRFRGHQLSGKTLGILGYGRLGRIIARYGEGFSMRVLACDTRNVEVEDGVELVDLDTILRESDVLSIHIHLTEENRFLIDKEAFSKMKQGSVLINTSRGAIIDEEAFLEALRSGPLGGAGVDVIVGEWDKNLEDHPLIRHANDNENLVISPHTGGVTYESQRMTLEFMAEKLKRSLESIE